MMKTLWNFILLMGLFCLAGCKEEEPQSVAFSIHEKTLGDKGEGFYVNIDANCPWTISCDCGYNLANKDSGEGPAEIFVYLFSNEDYEENVYRVTVTSEDGTSSDVLTVTQSEKIDFIPEPADLIHEDGGEFHINAKTNDDITSVTTSEWITWNSSRALSGHTYSFTAQPNKTGAKRNGHIRFRGERTDRKITVAQDSYAPTGVIVAELPKYTLPQTIKRPVQVLPEYADITKLELSATEKCDVALEKDTLSVNMHSYGVHSIRFISDGNRIKEMTTECLPEQPGYINKDMAEDMIREEELSPTIFYKKSDYIISSDRPDIVSVTGNGNIKAVNPGSANILIEHKEAKWSCAGFKVTVQPFRLTAKVHKAEHVYGNKYEVSFYAKAVGNKFTSFPEFYIQDTNGTQYLKGQGHILSSSYIDEITTGTLIVDTGDNYTLSSIISRLKFCVSVEVEGIKYSRSVEISWE